MTKDEFIKKFHTQKVLKFEPPTWEEFLATETDERWACWFCNNIMISMTRQNEEHGILHTIDGFYVKNLSDEGGVQIPYEYNEFIDNREKMYYKALDIAKWFLGENDD